MAISQYGNDYYGLSGDNKPIGTPLNGRKFTEMDTSKEYRYDAENQQWLQQNGEGGGGSSTLSGLTDVDISNPSDGQTLVYNATTQKWENGAGGGVLVVHNVDDTLDKTAGEIYEAYSSGQTCMVVESQTYEDSEESTESYSILVYASKNEYGNPPTEYYYAFRTRNTEWGANSPTEYPTASY